MKKIWIVLLSALILLGSISITSAAVYIDTFQRVYFNSTDSRSYYWAMIWDYTSSSLESSTSGFSNVDGYLSYICSFGNVQVAYIYSVATDRYEEALALRDVDL